MFTDSGDDRKKRKKKKKEKVRSMHCIPNTIYYIANPSIIMALNLYRLVVLIITYSFKNIKLYF